MYYFKNSSGNRGFIFPGGFLCNDDEGSLPVYYSLKYTTDGKRKFENVVDFVCAVQGFKIESLKEVNYQQARQTLNRMNQSTPRYERAETNAGEFNRCKSVKLFYDYSSMITGTNSN